MRHSATRYFRQMIAMARPLRATSTSSAGLSRSHQPWKLYSADRLVTQLQCGGSCILGTGRDDGEITDDNELLHSTDLLGKKAQRRPEFAGAVGQDERACVDARVGDRRHPIDTTLIPSNEAELRQWPIQGMQLEICDRQGF